jgi:hypothetical protein
MAQANATGLALNAGAVFLEWRWVGLLDRVMAVLLGLENLDWM